MNNDKKYIFIHIPMFPTTKNLKEGAGVRTHAESTLQLDLLIKD